MKIAPAILLALSIPQCIASSGIRGADMGRDDGEGHKLSRKLALGNLTEAFGHDDESLEAKRVPQSKGKKSVAIFEEDEDFAPAEPPTKNELDDLGERVKAASAGTFRVMTFNIRIDKATANLPRWSSRKNMVFDLIRHVDADIIGLQEVEDHTWEDIKDAFPRYHRYRRTRGGLSNPDEGVAILARGSRFNVRDNRSDEKTWNIAEQSARCFTNTGTNRNVMRLKLDDKSTGRVLDVFNTHFPARGNCFQKGMAKMVANWVEDYGDNIILMGDFNTGWNREGNMHEPMRYLYDKSSVDLDDVIRTEYRRSFRPSDSIITDKANEPWKRFGNMIDHIMIGPAYILDDAKIDRTLFRNGSPVPCGDRHMITDSAGNRDKCCSRGYCGELFTTHYPVEQMDSASDHWPVWADLRRIDCPDSC